VRIRADLGPNMHRRAHEHDELDRPEAAWFSKAAFMQACEVGKIILHGPMRWSRVSE
jgi:hypothetical protein